MRVYFRVKISENTNLSIYSLSDLNIVILSKMLKARKIVLKDLW